MRRIVSLGRLAPRRRTLVYLQVRMMDVTWPIFSTNSVPLDSSTSAPPNAGGAVAGNESGVTSDVSTAPNEAMGRATSVGNDHNAWLSTGGDFPFKLYGEDTRAHVTDANRVFSTSTSASYDPSAFVEEAQTQIRDSAAAAPSSASGAQATDLGQLLQGNEEQERATVASVAAAAVAMTADVKKPDVAVFTQPPPQQQVASDTGPTPLRFVSSKSSEVDTFRRGELLAQEIVLTENVPTAEMGTEDGKTDPQTDANDVEEEVNAKGENDEDDERLLVRDHMRNQVETTPLRSFDELGSRLPPWLSEGIVNSRLAVPTAVQSVAIPLLLEEHDLVGVAPTGSGKTIAFAVPSLTLLAEPPLVPTPAAADAVTATLQSGTTAKRKVEPNPAPPHAEGEAVSEMVSPRVLVLCPTRELVQQTHTVFKRLSNEAVRICAAFGGSSRERQLDILQRGGGCDVLVSTPGRLCDFLDAKHASLRRVELLVLDEADRMLELGFAAQLEFIMSNARRSAGGARRTTMWTATWSAAVGSLAARFMRRERLLLEASRARRQVGAHIAQHLYALDDASRRIAAMALLYDEGIVSKRAQVLVFANRISTVDALTADLRRALRAPPDLVQPLHGRMKQRRREAVVAAFREGSIRILCATDVAARGLDVPEIAHVVNYDLPADTDAYVHRVGRTGRAGRKGAAHTFIVAGDPRAPRIVRFVAEQSAEAVGDDVMAIVRGVELSGGGERLRERFRSHARVAGRSWRSPPNTSPSRETESRFVRGVGRVMTIARPKAKGNGRGSEGGEKTS